MSRKSSVTKICSMCNETKSLSDFYLNKTKKDGFNGICKECQRKVNENKKI